MYDLQPILELPLRFVFATDLKRLQQSQGLGSQSGVEGTMHSIRAPSTPLRDLIECNLYKTFPKQDVDCK